MCENDPNYSAPQPLHFINNEVIRDFATSDLTKRLYDVQAYLEKTLDNVESGDFAWTGAEAVEFIKDTLEFLRPTPTTEQVRHVYAYVGQGFAPSERKSRAEAEAEFDRWFAANVTFWKEQAEGYERELSGYKSAERPEPLGSYQDGVFTPSSGPMTDGSSHA